MQMIIPGTGNPEGEKLAKWAMKEDRSAAAAPPVLFLPGGGQGGKKARRNSRRPAFLAAGQ